MKHNIAILSIIVLFFQYCVLGARFYEYDHGAAHTATGWMSKDGSTVAFSSGTIWNPGQSSYQLPGDYVHIESISWNASYMTGTVQSISRTESFIWNEFAGYETLGSIVNTLAVTEAGDRASVTYQYPPPAIFPFNLEPGIWTRDEGFTAYPSNINDLVKFFSKDGQVAVGLDSVQNSFYHWSNESGVVYSSIPSGYDGFQIADITPDAGTVVGQLTKGTIEYPMYWNEQDGFVVLDYLDPSFSQAYAGGVNYDGTLIVGASAPDNHPDDFLAFIWDPHNGVRNLQNVLENQYGLNLDGWILTDAIDLSEDGTTIFGRGIDPDGNFDFWVAEIPEPATVSLLALGGLALLRKRK